ncbi:MAG: DUF1858 domain-containing protein [Nanoarchaeota archaeon]|nr:DUF1858 domain-containing protein [Nanoarchaeota archaeon]
MTEKKTQGKDKDAKIKKDMMLGDVVSKFPEAAPVMFKYGLHCIGCHVSAYETIEQGSLAHGLTDKDVERMVKEMNEAVEKKK